MCLADVSCIAACRNIFVVNDYLIKRFCDFEETSCRGLLVWVDVQAQFEVFTYHFLTRAQVFNNLLKIVLA